MRMDQKLDPLPYQSGVIAYQDWLDSSEDQRRLSSLPSALRL